MALVLVLSGRLVGSRSASAMSVWLRGAILFAVGVAVLAAGLVLWGRDGKMLTYAALVVACATCHPEGAEDGHVWLFPGDGPRRTQTLLGGLSGLLLARLAGLGIDILSRRVLPEFPFKPESYFWFSPELLLILLGFSVLVCLIGAALPAWTAAKLSPAQALSGRPS